MTKVKGSRGYKSQKECGSKQNIFFFKTGAKRTRLCVGSVQSSHVTLR